MKKAELIKELKTQPDTWNVGDNKNDIRLYRAIFMALLYLVKRK